MRGCAPTKLPAGLRCATARRLYRKSVHTGKRILIYPKSRTHTTAANVAIKTGRNPGPVATVIARQGWSGNSRIPAGHFSSACAKLQTTNPISGYLASPLQSEPRISLARSGHAESLAFHRLLSHRANRSDPDPFARGAQVRQGERTVGRAHSRENH